METKTTQAEKETNMEYLTNRELQDWLVEANEAGNKEEVEEIRQEIARRQG